MSLSMALANGLPKEEIRALLLSEMQRRVESRKRRWIALDGPQTEFVNHEHRHILFGGARGGS